MTNDHTDSYTAQDRVEGGDLTLHGWWFNIDTGELWTADQGAGVFQLPPV